MTQFLYDKHDRLFIYPLGAMMRRFLLALTLFITTMPIVAPHAGEVPQTPQSITLDYAVGPDGTLYMMMKSFPAITGCGSFTEWPMNATADYESIDLRLGGYAFVHPDGTTDKKSCGTGYKAASANIAFSPDEIKTTKRIRLWYGDTLDTLVLQRAATQDGLTLAPVGTPKLFKMGKKLGEVPGTTATPAPPTETKEPAPAAAPVLENVILLSTGEDAADKILQLQIVEMAAMKGLLPTPNPDLFFDKTGQYYKRLATEKTIEIGAIMVEGQRIPIYGIRLDQGQKK
jgi:hypothetical protein